MTSRMKAFSAMLLAAAINGRRGVAADRDRRLQGPASDPRRSASGDDGTLMMMTAAAAALLEVLLDPWRNRKSINHVESHVAKYDELAEMFERVHTA